MVNEEYMKKVTTELDGFNILSFFSLSKHNTDNQIALAKKEISIPNRLKNKRLTKTAEKSTVGLNGKIEKTNE